MASINPNSPQPGIFYKIKDEQGKTKGYLLGTMHDIPKGKSINLQKVNNYFSKSKDVIVEIDLLKTLMKSGLSPKNK